MNQQLYDFIVTGKHRSYRPEHPEIADLASDYDGDIFKKDFVDDCAQKEKFY